MELKEYIKTIKKNLKLILIIGIVTAVSAFLFSLMRPVKYETSLSLTVIKDKTQLTDDFKYDDYYALQSGGIIADSTEQWLKSPEVVNAIYQRSQINYEFKDIKSYAKKFTAKKMSPQYVEVKFKSDTKGEAEKISAAIAEVINAKVEKLKESNGQEVSFLVNGENPIIIENKPDTILNLIIGLISGLALGIFVVFLRRYLAF